MQNREYLIEKFIENNNLNGFERHRLASDASFRAYERLRKDNKSFMIMDAPPEKEKVTEFISIANYLNDHGFSAPKILNADVENGFILLEDFGDDSFSSVLSGNSQYNNRFDEEELYLLAIQTLIDLNKKPTKSDLPHYNREVYMREVNLLTDWYLTNIESGNKEDSAALEYDSIWSHIIEENNINSTETVVLRDYHADNLMWLPIRDGSSKVGLLDFQDALLGSPVYDIISLLEDARRDVSEETVNKCIAYYLKQNPQLDKNKFMTEYSIIAAQRNCKIVGIFARLAIRDGKERYLSYLPRVWQHLENDLKHPALIKLKIWMDKNIPSDFRKKDSIKLPDELFAVG